jgi:hypothetical protein
VLRAVQTGVADAMPPLRYDVEDPGQQGTFRERYWCPTNVPVKNADGEVVLILHVVEEIPDLIPKFVEAEAARA